MAGAFLAAGVFFIGYNNYLLDKTLSNLKVSLKQLDKEKGQRIAESVRDILDDTFIMEIARKDLDASTLVNGAFVILAILRAISVFPTPVAPINRMLFGIMSPFISDFTFMRRQRFRIEMATFFLALS